MYRGDVNKKYSRLKKPRWQPQLSSWKSISNLFSWTERPSDSSIHWKCQLQPWGKRKLPHPRVSTLVLRWAIQGHLGPPVQCYETRRLWSSVHRKPIAVRCTRGIWNVVSTVHFQKNSFTFHFSRTNINLSGTENNNATNISFRPI